MHNEAVQLDLLRRATVARRVAFAVSLTETVIGLACRAIRRQNPDLSKKELLVRFVDIHYGPELAEALHTDLRRRPE